jgi:hypothetical protein
VTLKLIFDDPRHPDFELDLWLEGDEQRRESRSPADAIQEANRWLARADAIVRRDDRSIFDCCDAATGVKRRRWP